MSAGGDGTWEVPTSDSQGMGKFETGTASGPAAANNSSIKYPYLRS